MANYSSNYSQTQNPFSSFVLLSISITFFFFLLLNEVSAEIVSFDFNGFHRVQQNLIFQGDAVITPSPGALDLTNEIKDQAVYPSVGRVLYETPIQIWDSEINTIASFQTNFSFLIGTHDKTKSASGLAFFLAPLETQPQYRTGGLLGIFSDVESHEPIVAVEFDTFSDPWDPKGHHIGIDVNNIKSTRTTEWDLSFGNTATVSISYDAQTYSLKVSVVQHSYSEITYTLEDSVDLRDVLPQWIRVGLSATTGDSTEFVETHYVYSWSFYSELPDSPSSTLGFKFNRTNDLSS